MRPVDLERFWGCIEESEEPDGCWIWVGYISDKGRPRFVHNSRQEAANRVMYRLDKGEAPRNAWVLQTCKNVLCLNPDHLFLSMRTKKAELKNKKKLRCKDCNRMQSMDKFETLRGINGRCADCRDLNNDPRLAIGYGIGTRSLKIKVRQS